ncbi:hypothetical protein [Parafrankia discariae]|uniref:hypothetical protein n=1 Tax=Parafrankia discariae TaxID=365528 RepID=UPI00036A6B85|nr:hypothetical protein [Parafrankia discariae]
MSSDPGAARSRAARRRFILDNHPDRGGDPEAFQAGLRAFTTTDTTRAGAVTFYRRRGPFGRARARLARGADANRWIANWRARAANWKVEATRPRLAIRLTRRAGGGTRRSGAGGTPGHRRCR